jgi:hypothetical protein
MAIGVEAKKGVFALEEGNWWGDPRKTSSIEPLLAMLHQQGLHQLPYFHREIDTRQAFDYYVEQWTQARYVSMPVLYLGFHGSDGKLLVGDGRRQGAAVALDEIEEILNEKAQGRMLHLASCGIMDANGNRLNRFLERTGLVAITGFRQDVDYIESAAFELLFFTSLQENAFTVSGANAILKRLKSRARGLIDYLGFRMRVRPT